MPPKLPKIGVGAIGAGAGFFAAVLFFAGVALFIPFFLRAGAPRFAFLDFFAFAFRFFAMISLPIGSTNTLYIISNHVENPKVIAVATETPYGEGADAVGAHVGENHWSAG